jgi:hypothetical protein
MRKIYYREIRKKTMCDDNFFSENNDEERVFDDSFFSIIQQLKKYKKEKNKLIFKKTDRFLKKIKRPFFFEWITHYKHEPKLVFQFVCAFGFFVLKKQTLSNGIFSRYLFFNKKFYNTGPSKLISEKSILTQKEKKICLHMGINPFQFLRYKKAIILSLFFFSFKNLKLLQKNIIEITVFFRFFERFFLDFEKLVKKF